jgi:hypothetical protein
MISGMNRTASLVVTSGLLLVACSGRPAPSIQGTLERHRIEVAPQQSEQIVRLLVREGEAVVAGQLLAELDSGTQTAGREALAAELQRAVPLTPSSRRPKRSTCGCGISAPPGSRRRRNWTCSNACATAPLPT